jgi:hypothetical protein
MGLCTSTVSRGCGLTVFGCMYYRDPEVIERGTQMKKGRTCPIPTSLVHRLEVAQPRGDDKVTARLHRSTPPFCSSSKPDLPHHVHAYKRMECLDELSHRVWPLHPSISPSPSTYRQCSTSRKAACTLLAPSLTHKWTVKLSLTSMTPTLRLRQARASNKTTIQVLTAST